MLNLVQLIGHLGRDPEVRTMNSGDKVANLSLATTEKWKDKQSGERKEKTEWHRVTVWGALAGIAEQYLRKGSKVYVSGKLETRKWQDQSGADRYSTEIVLRGFDGKLVMLDGPNAREGGGERDGGQAPDYGSGYGEPNGGGSPGPDLDDDIPF